ncbi:MAG TPA: type II secretion system F family protein [Alphaproteobacteria bacterium]
MPKFRYTAVGAAGKVVKGIMEAPDRAAVVERLHAERQLPLEAALVGSASSRISALLSLELGAASRLSRRELTEFTRELAVMLGAGQDLDRALRFIVDTTRAKAPRAIFTDIRDKVRDGAALASALSAHADSFPRLYVGLVRAGEAGGTLGETLERLTELLDRERSLAANLHSALIYPALLVTAAMGTIVMLLAYVLPQFTPIFEQAGATLPPATRLLIELGDAARQYGALGLALIVAAVFAARQVLRRPGPRLSVDGWLLAVPVLGELLREIEAARLCRTLSTLLKSGVGLLPALGIVREVLGNRRIANAVEHATTGVKGGARLAATLDGTGNFPPRTVDLLRLGEETGRLPEMALRAAQIHEEQVRQNVERLVGLLVPVITIVTGLVVAGIVAALVTAMLSLNELAL